MKPFTLEIRTQKHEAYGEALKEGARRVSAHTWWFNVRFSSSGIGA